MSVAALLDLYHATTIADEIESFFNVVLYNAIRYLPHNVEPYVDDFIKSYFTDSRPLKGIRVCSSVKEGFVRGGLLTHAGHNIVFESKPLTAILQQLLTYISARYAVLAYEAERQDSQTTELSNAAASPPGEPLTETPDLPEDLTLADFADALPVTYTTLTLREPTEKIKQDAQRIATHKAVRLVLWKVSSVQYSGLWPSDEVVQDHIVPVPIPPPMMDATFSATATGSRLALSSSMNVSIIDPSPKPPKRLKTGSKSGGSV